MTIKVIAHTLLSRFLLIIVVLVFLPAIAIFMVIPQRWRYAHPIVFLPVYWFYWAILKCTLVPIRYEGLENIPQHPVVFVGNHQSSLDIPLMGILSGKTPHVWLAKHELMDSFLIRFVVPLIAVLVDASSVRNGMLSLRRIITLIRKKNCNLMIFPEGGRFIDGKIHPFFGGFSIVARNIQRPVVPVCIIGVNKVYPPESLFVYSHPITVVVGPPFELQQGETDDTFKERVHAWFVEQMEKA